MLDHGRIQLGPLLNYSPLLAALDERHNGSGLDPSVYWEPAYGLYVAVLEFGLDHLHKSLAEKGGFEPPVPLRVRQVSNLLP